MTEAKYMGIIGSALMLTGTCQGVSWGAPVPAGVEQNEAGENLQREQQERQEEAARRNGEINLKNIVVPIEQVEIHADGKMTEREIRYILPELYRKNGQVRIHRLAQQLQMANESGAAVFHADFHDSAVSGKLAVTLTVKELPSQHGAITVSNTGNEYTGDWRTTASFIQSNLSSRLDSLGVAWVTSPEKFTDVQQGALSYRYMTPKTLGTWNLNASYSNVDLGNIASSNLAGILEYTAKGQGTNVGLHYQKHLAYTAKERDSWDFGIDYQRSNSKYSITFQAFIPYTDAWTQDYHVTTASVDFQHLERGRQHVFYWDAGVASSLDNAGKNYQAVTPGSDNQFTAFRGNLIYQYRTKTNWILGTRWQGQYTQQHLVSLAQLGAGGARTVRGFNERAISADKGILGNVEIYTPEICRGLRLLAFVDFASLANNLNANTNTFGNEKIASAGIGLRYTNEKSGLGISLDYAKIIDDVEETRDGSYRRWNVNCSYKF